MIYDPIDGLPEEPDYALRAALEPFPCDIEEVLEDEYDEDVDPTPYGTWMVTDPIDAPSYAGWAWGA